MSWNGKICVLDLICYVLKIANIYNYNYNDHLHSASVKIQTFFPKVRKIHYKTKNVKNMHKKLSKYVKIN